MSDVQVLHGDALELLPTLGATSVDAVVTDPPYGLEFMGREWDAPWQRGVGMGGNTAGLGKVEMADGAERLQRPNYYGSPNPTCRNCGGLKRGCEGKKSQPPCRCDAPRFDDVIGPRMRAYQAWCEQWAAECLRVLKPGGFLLAFGGTRTWHRLTCAVEDAGFEIRDSTLDLTGRESAGLAWVYGSGFPKSLDVSKAIDKVAGAVREVVGTATYGDGHVQRSTESIGYHGSDPDRDSRNLTAPATDEARRWQGWGTALKPGWEPIVVARKPLTGTVAANVLAHGTGALNIDGCRVGVSDADAEAMQRANTPGAGRFKAGRAEPGAMGRSNPGQPLDTTQGRWPPNVVLDEAAAAELDRQSGTLTSGANPTRRGSDKFRDAYGDFRGQEECTPARGADSGGASRFFPTFRYEPKAPADQRPRVNGTAHPTVKPLDLMRWLVRLVTPPGGLVLDPFAGSGTTGEACIVEGFHAVLIEREADYLPLIHARLNKPIQPTLEVAP